MLRSRPAAGSAAQFPASAAVGRLLPDVIVVEPPAFDDDADLSQGGEDFAARSKFAFPMRRPPRATTLTPSLMARTKGGHFDA